METAKKKQKKPGSITSCQHRILRHLGLSFLRASWQLLPSLFEYEKIHIPPDVPSRRTAGFLTPVRLIRPSVPFSVGLKRADFRYLFLLEWQ